HQADEGGDDRGEKHTEERVAERGERRGVGEHERVVLPPDELRSGPIEEGHVHGAQRGPDEPDDQEQRRRATENHQREEGAGALHPTIGRPRDEEQHGKNSEEGKDDPRHLDELIARGEPHRYLSSPHSKTGSAASSTRPSRQRRGTPFFRETQAMWGGL